MDDVVTAKAKTAANPVVTEIVRNGLVAVTEEMKINLMRTAYNMIIYEALDFTTGLFTPAGDPARNIWFARDSAAIAAAKDVADAAPFFVEMESPVPPGGLPHPGPVQPSLPNNHLQYALTWLGLAAVLVGVYTASMVGRWRGRY